MKHLRSNVTDSLRGGLGWGRLALLVVLPASLLALGCGDGRYPVRGTVTFDGRPVADGVISFVPDNPALASDAGRIEAGRFHVYAKPGPKRVEIRASRPVQSPDPRDPDGPNLREDFIPPRYNTETELTAEVTASHNEFRFELHSGGR